MDAKELMVEYEKEHKSYLEICEMFEYGECGYAEVDIAWEKVCKAWEVYFNQYEVENA